MVNAGLKFVLYNETETGMEMFEYYYENGIVDYVKETVGDDSFTTVETWEMEREGRDRADKEDYRMKMQVAFCFSNKVNMLEYYHNSSYLEHGGSPDKAVRNAFVYAIDRYLKQNDKYNKTIQNNICGRSGLFGACYKFILNSDKLRKPNEKSDK